MLITLETMNVLIVFWDLFMVVLPSKIAIKLLQLLVITTIILTRIINTYVHRTRRLVLNTLNDLNEERN